MESRFFRTRDGLRLHYISHPCAVADCKNYCILLHGFTNDAHIWDAMASELQAEYHVIALDQRGHGDSDWDPERKYSHWQLAEDLHDFLQEFGNANIHIVGHSLGARVAILALESLRSAVASLTIIDAGPEVSPEAGERLVHDVMQLPAHYVDAKAYFNCMARIYVMSDAKALAHVTSFGLRVSRGKLSAKTDPAFTPGIWHKNREFRDLNKNRGELSERIWKALTSLALPVHIVRGQASSILEPELALKMVQLLGDRAVLSVVPRAGHAVMMDNPLKSTAVIIEFIRSADKSADKSSDKSSDKVDGPVLRDKVLESRA